MMQTGKKYQVFLTEFFFRLACSCFLLIPAFGNGYPLINPDTNTYLRSGFDLFHPVDRPIMYGLLIRLFSWNGATLWTVILIQAYIVCWLLMLIIKRFASGKEFYNLSAITIISLSLLTSLSWVTSELVPDIFTPIAFLSAICILSFSNNKSTQIVLYLIFFIAVCTHVSHVMTFFIVALIILLFVKYLVIKNDRKHVIISLLIMMALCCTAAYVQSPTTSKSTHAFVMASMVEKGVLIPYLQDNCAEKNYKICEYKDKLQENSVWFLWNPASPAFDRWDATRKEYTTINKDILLHAPYNIMFIKKSLECTIQQLAVFNIGDGNYPSDSNSSIVNSILSTVSGKESEDFINDKQNQIWLIDKLGIPNLIINITMVLSCVIIILLFIINRKRTPAALKFIILSSIIVIIINAWNCASFSTVLGRYNCRIIWLIPFCAILMLNSLKTNSTYRQQ